MFLNYLRSFVDYLRIICSGLFDSCLNVLDYLSLLTYMFVSGDLDRSPSSSRPQARLAARGATATAGDQQARPARARSALLMFVVSYRAPTLRKVSRTWAPLERGECLHILHMLQYCMLNHSI